jgi:hypothetical protein
VFRNRERLELVFDLMALDLSKDANELRYREIIRSYLLTNDGRPTRKRRALDDQDGSSIHRGVVEGRGSPQAPAGAERPRSARPPERLKQAGNYS